ncbi:MAG TPA: cell division protein, partial [Romboutsia sp.]|nr:cell division protein [Romboutsia sp.]
MNTIEKTQSAKIIGIGEDGINTLDSISNKVAHNMNLEKININQDVDKDYVRELLDGVDVLFLTYNSEDKKALQIVNAIGYMA